MLSQQSSLVSSAHSPSRLVKDSQSPCIATRCDWWRRFHSEILYLEIVAGHLLEMIMLWDG